MLSKVYAVGVSGGKGGVPCGGPETQRGLQRRERNNVGMVKVHHLGANQVTEQAQDVKQWEGVWERER